MARGLGRKPLGVGGALGGSWLGPARALAGALAGGVLWGPLALNRPPGKGLRFVWGFTLATRKVVWVPAIPEPSTDVVVNKADVRWPVQDRR